MAVKLYQKYGRRVAPVIRKLGFPDRHMLVKWVKEYESTGDLHNFSKREPKFSESEKKRALQYYQEHGESIIVTIKALGYPSKSTFKRWLNEAFPNRKKYCISGGAMVKFPQEKKEQAVIDLKIGETASQLSFQRFMEFGYLGVHFSVTRSKAARAFCSSAA